MGLFQHDCPHCFTAKVAFAIQEQFEAIWRNEEYNEEYIDVIAHCSGCKRGVISTFRRNGASAFPSAIKGNICTQGWVLSTVHPKLPSVAAPEHLPTPIADTLSGALKSLVAGIWSGAGMLARKTIEMTVAARLGQTEVSNLRAAMAKLKDAGELPAYVGEWGEHIRALGNDAAHRGDFNEEEAREAVEFAEEFARSLYTRPERIRLARERYESKKAGG